MDLGLLGITTSLLGAITYPTWNRCIKEQHFRNASNYASQEDRKALQALHPILKKHFENDQKTKNYLLAIATKYGNIPAMKLLLYYEADPNHLIPIEHNANTLKKGHYPLLYFVLAYNTQFPFKAFGDLDYNKLCKVVHTLCKAGANPNAYSVVTDYTDKKSDRYKRYKWAQNCWLFEEESTIIFPPIPVHPTYIYDKDTILHRLTKHLNEKSLIWIPLLLEYGANPNLRMYNGNTPLHLLAKPQDPELEAKKPYLIWLFLHYGAFKNLNALNWERQTPLDKTDTYNLQNILDMLINEKPPKYKKFRNIVSEKQITFIYEKEADFNKKLPEQFPTKAFDFYQYAKAPSSITKRLISLTHREIGQKKPFVKQ